MADVGSYLFNYKEIVETLIKRQDLHEGIWQLQVKFGLGAMNAGPTEAELVPSAILGIMQIGIIKVDKENNLAVDAAKVNPMKTE